jgi:hypothetical protein
LPLLLKHGKSSIVRMAQRFTEKRLPVLTVRAV